MVTVAPSGQIIHISQGYRGKASDKFISNEENLFEHFTEKQSIMVDKGFEIYKECTEKGEVILFFCKLIKISLKCVFKYRYKIISASIS